MIRKEDGRSSQSAQIVEQPDDNDDRKGEDRKNDDDRKDDDDHKDKDDVDDDRDRCSPMFLIEGDFCEETCLASSSQLADAMGYKEGTCKERFCGEKCIMKATI